MIDDAGRRYVDFESGVWCLPLGHNHPSVNKAIRHQLEAISHVGYRYTTPVVEAAASRILDVLGLEPGRCVFLASGSEAVELGVQLALAATGKPLLVGLSGHFLSSYGTTATQDGQRWRLIDPIGDADAMLRDVPFEQVAAFVFEPGNASGRVALPPPGLVEAITERVKQASGLVVVDEVTTGMGRTGAWFGFQHYGLRPDVVALGKGVGNGYPVSVVAVAERVAEAVEAQGFHYAQSHQDDPMGCAVAAKVISTIQKENLIERSTRSGRVLRAALEGLRRRHSCVSDVRGRGLMVAAGLDGAVPVAQVHRRMFDTGFIIGAHTPSNSLRFYPPLIIGEEEIRSMVSALDDVLSGMASVPANEQNLNLRPLRGSVLARDGAE